MAYDNSYEVLKAAFDAQGGTFNVNPNNEYEVLRAVLDTENECLRVNIDGYVSGGTTSSDIFYTNSSSTYTTLGGIVAGSSFSGNSMKQMWDDLLYPELTPRFSSFILVGQDTSIDIGDTISAGAETWNWNTANDGWIKANSVKVLDYTNGDVYGTGLANDGTEVLSIPSDITKTTRTNNRWVIYSQKTNDSWFGRNFYVSWYWRNYFGGSTNPSLINTEVAVLSDSTLTNLFTETFDFPASSTYKYIAIPKVNGYINPVNGHWYVGTPSYIVDRATNLNVAMAGTSDGYTETINGIPYKTLTIDNTNGLSTDYYVFRTKYMLGGDIEIIVK